MADARTVANRLIELANQRGTPLTPMQILKLVYIAHGWMLGLTGRPLVQQNVEAWQYGPVIRELYSATRAYGQRPVTQPVFAPNEVLDSTEQNMVDQVFNLYGQMDGIALSNITHMPNTPWAQTYRHGSFGVIIPDDLIKAHYQRLSHERRNNA